MSWDVLLFKNKFDLNDEQVDPGILGNRSLVIKSLVALIPGLNYADPSWGVLEAPEFSIEFNTGNDEVVNSIMLHIRGGGNPLAVIKLICDELKWVALDCSTSDFMDTENLSANSWLAFQAYRDQISRIDTHKKTITINGTTISDLESFYTEVDRVFTKDLGWQTGHNLNAFNDILRGGFGVYEYEEPVKVFWTHFTESSNRLGPELTGILLEIIARHDHIAFETQD
ncbi:barstar family protein [Niabella sp. CC-SYL272]|uniref:barstar family protein n=1 Tax=Niabella agricola TaxID=2891571 RepID=UPI001F458A61|nr:barstar family protein [Niabella agricola]MCF3110902.1 barstar family protein [Niabella agricola]